MAKKARSITCKTGSFTDPESRRRLGQRLKRIEGQVRAIHAMVEDNKYCMDVLTQVTAAQEGLRAVGQEVIRSHLKHCVGQAVGESDTKADEVIEELLAVLKKYR